MPDSVILAIDTCLGACGAAVLDRGVVRAVRVEPMARGQSERLAPLVRDLLAEAGLRARDLTSIAVTVGPGSFTGVRVGLSFARGLALALGAPCHGVSTLEALALEGGSQGLRGGVIVSTGAAYVALYRDGQEVLAPMTCEREELAARLEAAAAGEPLSLFGPGAAGVAKGLSGALGADRVSADPVTIARIAAARPLPDGPPAPLYLRAPDIAPPASR